jgi:FkbM family methyltransferase
MTAAANPETPYGRIGTADTWTLRLKGGESLVVPATLRNFSTYALLETEDWFETEVDFVRTLLPPGSRAIDVGANLGFYTMVLARSVGPAGRVWAVEPDRSITGLIGQSLAANALSNVSVLDVALGDFTGDAAIERQVSPEFNVIRRTDDAAAETRVVHLDDMAAAEGLRDIAFVKLDAEGMETAILRGGAAFFARESPLIMTELRHGKHIQHDLLDALKALGYRLWRYAPALNRLTPLLGDHTDFYSLNIFACKPDRAGYLAEAGKLVDPRDNLAQLSATDAYALSRDPHVAAGTRAAALIHSFRVMNTFCQQEPGIAALSALARISGDLGMQEMLVAALQPVVMRLQEAAPIDLPDASLLAADPRYDALDRSDVNAWFISSVLETYARNKHATTYGHRDYADMIDVIQRFGFGTAELERRHQLFAIASGRQAAPAVTEPLERNPDATLNWWFWRGE